MLPLNNMNEEGEGKGGFVDEATDVSIEINLALLPSLLCRRECGCDCVCLYVDCMMNLQLFWTAPEHATLSAGPMVKENGWMDRWMKG